MGILTISQSNVDKPSIKYRQSVKKILTNRQSKIDKTSMYI